MSPSAERLARHPFWHAVGIAMTPYARVGHHVETIVAGAFRLGEGTLFVSTHRADTDAPILIGALYTKSGAWADSSQRLHFAARDDLFERGFFAGFPSRLPFAVRRALYPISIDRFLPMVRVHPLGSARSMRLGQALRLVDPETPLPEEVAALFAERAGAAAPRTAGEALSGEFADLLWRIVRPEDLPLEEAWARRGAEARRHLETLVELLRAGEPMLLFPEGRPSPDGAVGPLRRGLGLLIRRGRPRRILPLGISYDPFTRGRARAFPSIGVPFEAEGRDIEAQVLDRLRLAMPLTTGVYVAHALLGGAAATTDGLAAGLAREVDESLAEGRPVERSLVGRRRLDRLSEALGALRRRGLLETPDGGRLRVLPALADDPLVRRAALEFRSARQGRPAT